MQESWREAIGALGEIARQEGVLPESLLVHLKKVLDDFEGLQASPGETAETPRSVAATRTFPSGDFAMLYPIFIPFPPF